jgi:hypothetical protein
MLLLFPFFMLLCFIFSKTENYIIQPLKWTPLNRPEVWDILQVFSG